MYMCTCKLIKILRGLVDSISTCTCVLVIDNAIQRFYKYMYMCTCKFIMLLRGLVDSISTCTCVLVN